MKKILKHAIRYEGLNKVNFNVIIVDNTYIHNLNKEYRHIDRETDVITFAHEDYAMDTYNNTRILGDIYISLDNVLRNALDILRNINWAEYEHVVFIAKSLGTIVACNVKERLQIPASQWLH